MSVYPYYRNYCHDLSTKPISGYKILVTGATGYIGGELVPELVHRGYQVYVLTRSISPDHINRWPGVQFIIGNARNYSDLENALKGIHCAYYLMHSLQLRDKKFLKVDQQVAANFRKAADKNNLKRIIYLGGLGDQDINLSSHLLSRLMVAQELQKGNVPVTYLKAAVIIGAGSTSFRIINYLVKNCPVFLFPRKSDSKCQPIAVEDVIKYLIGCLETVETAGKSLDIGGDKIITYQSMLKVQANILNKKRYFITSSYSTIRSYARIANLLTPVSFEVIKNLMESCDHDAICQNNDIQQLIPFKTVPYEVAVKKALGMDSEVTLNGSKFHNFEETGNLKSVNRTLIPPNRSKNMLSDIRYFLFNRPPVSTLIKFNSKTERENYTFRILQRLDVGVTDYNILNIHQIGVNAPAKYIFEELLKWNGDSTCWPNHIAKVVRDHDNLEHLEIYLFGKSKFPKFIKKLLQRYKLIPFFKLDVIEFQTIPNPISPDNSRYLLYECSGGYPIGVFSMYVRSSIEGQNETEQSQLFLMVGFNFYGKKNWSRLRLTSRAWEYFHDRVTNNVLWRIKQLSEWRFEKIQNG